MSEFLSGPKVLPRALQLKSLKVKSRLERLPVRAAKPATLAQVQGCLHQHLKNVPWQKREIICMSIYYILISCQLKCRKELSQENCSGFGCHSKALKILAFNQQSSVRAGAFQAGDMFPLSFADKSWSTGLNVDDLL